MTDAGSTSIAHYRELIRDLNNWMKRLMAVNDARGLLECGQELKWLSWRAGIRV